MVYISCFVLLASSSSSTLWQYITYKILYSYNLKLKQYTIYIYFFESLHVFPQNMHYLVWYPKESNNNVGNVFLCKSIAQRLPFTKFITTIYFTWDKPYLLIRTMRLGWCYFYLKLGLSLRLSSQSIILLKADLWLLLSILITLEMIQILDLN